MKKQETNKQKLIEAFDLSETKAVADVCRIANVPRYSFYYYLRQDKSFKKKFLAKMQSDIVQRIAAV